jgi:phosphoribosylaminoimidazolecarboxamide formyltransferase/IMP cyclohydrolase
MRLLLLRHNVVSELYHHWPNTLMLALPAGVYDTRKNLTGGVMSELADNQGAAGNALISVYDKTGIEEFAGGLHELGRDIYASGGTTRAIDAAGVPVTDVAELVGGDAILGHKVVTLSREVAAGLLADLDKPEEMEEMQTLGLPILHLVCQDSYPLEEEIAKPGATPTSVLEKSDIGGPNMLREGAKGGRIVLSVAEQRAQVLDWLRNGRPEESEFVRALADRAVYEVARYTMLEAKYWNGANMSGHIALLDVPTKYGENPQQADAAFYSDNRINADPLGLDQFVHVKGWERSLVNFTDMDRLVQTSTHVAAGFERNFGEVPAMAIGVKHGNACGAGVAEDLVSAVEKMLDGDTRAIFGGSVMINGEITPEIAEVLMHHAMEEGQTRLLDSVVGASVTEEALEILSRKKLRVVVNPALANLSEASLETSRRVRPVRGGYLEQPNYTFVQDFNAEGMQEFGEISLQKRKDMILAWAVGCTSNSNTITLVKDGQLIGNGVGQQDRVGAGQLALSRTTIEVPEITRQNHEMKMTIFLDKHKVRGAVAYSDSFFPYPDGPLLLADAGIEAIMTSSGSVADEEVFKALVGAHVSVCAVPDKKGRGFYAH